MNSDNTQQESVKPEPESAKPEQESVEPVESAKPVESVNQSEPTSESIKVEKDKLEEEIKALNLEVEKNKPSLERLYGQKSEHDALIKSSSGWFGNKTKAAEQQKSLTEIENKIQTLRESSKKLMNKRTALVHQRYLEWELKYKSGDTTNGFFTGNFFSFPEHKAQFTPLLAIDAEGYKIMNSLPSQTIDKLRQYRDDCQYLLKICDKVSDDIKDQFKKGSNPTELERSKAVTQYMDKSNWESKESLYFELYKHCLSRIKKINAEIERRETSTNTSTAKKSGWGFFGGKTLKRTKRRTKRRTKTINKKKKQVRNKSKR